MLVLLDTRFAVDGGEKTGEAIYIPRVGSRSTSLNFLQRWTLTKPVVIGCVYNGSSLPALYLALNHALIGPAQISPTKNKRFNL